MQKLALLLFFALSTNPSHGDDPLASLSDVRIDLEMKEAPIADVMLLVESLIDEKVVLDPCVSGAVSLKLKAVTVRTFLDVVAETLSLDYQRSAQGDLLVGCRSAKHTEQRVDMSVVDAPLDVVLATLSNTGGVHLGSTGCDDVRVDLNISNAPTSAVFQTIADQTSGTIETHQDGLMLHCDED